MNQPVIARLTALTALAAGMTFGPMTQSLGAQMKADRAFNTVSVKEAEGLAIQREPQVANGQFSWQGAPLIRLVQYAFDRQASTIEGKLPLVIYDIAATYPPTATTREIRDMLTGLLKGQFQLRTHTEARQTTVSEITVDGTGTRLVGAKMTGASEAQRGVRLEASSERTSLTGRNVTLKEIVDAMADIVVKRPVIDKTGLAGSFNIDVVYSRGSEKAPAPGLAPFASALRSQAGLQLTERSGKVDVLVVDQIQAP